MTRILLFAMAMLLLIPNFIDRNLSEKLPYNHTEAYEPSLAYLNSLKKLEAHTDTLAQAQKIAIGSLDYFVLLESIVSKRFYHGFSFYSLKENWIAAVGEKVYGGLGIKVQPEDMMKHASAGCSQQTAIMMAIAKSKKVNYRYTGFPHHYALDIKEDGKWYFFDPNMEPKITKSERQNTNWKEENDSLKKFYPRNLHSELDYQLGVHTKAFFGPENENPAANLKMFQSITAVVSRIAWIIPAALFFILIRRRKTVLKKTKRSYSPDNDLYPVLSM